MELPDDIELMLRVREDDMGAFRVLAARWRGPLRRFFAAMLADASLADDCAQDTFLRLWTLRGRYEPTGRFSAYLFQIARHHGLNQRKKYRPEVPLDDPDSHDDGLCILAPRVSEPEAVLLARVRGEMIRRAIDALPEIYRQVFTMGHLEQRPYAQIACELGIPLGTVKSRMAGAVRRLRQALEDEDNG